MSDWIILNSVGNVMDTSSLCTWPLGYNNDVTMYMMDETELQDIDNDEWWQELSQQDADAIAFYLSERSDIAKEIDGKYIDLLIQKRLQL